MERTVIVIRNGQIIKMYDFVYKAFLNCKGG